MTLLLRCIFMCTLIFTFFMPWYNAFGAKDVSGFTIPIWEEISIFFFLYLTPLFSTISMYRIIIGRNPGVFYLLSGIPNVCFWLLLFLTDNLYAPWKYSYLGGKVGLFVSLLVIVTYFIPFAVPNTRKITHAKKKDM
ncbi:hypothetical protein [Bacillus luti]|uniref:hypothetical protein n=1 Tax=Bacillus luti TaxID=2026191 RepID=UPI0012E874BD|nr:hypothetical protein [Bacillus luti]